MVLFLLVSISVYVGELVVGSEVVGMVLVAEVDNAEHNRVLLVFHVHGWHAFHSMCHVHPSLSNSSDFLLEGSMMS